MYYLASVSDALKVWNVSPEVEQEFKLQSTHRSTSEYLCLSWNHTNQVVAVGGRDNQVHIIQASNGAHLQALQITETPISNFKVPTLSFSHNSRYLAVGYESIVQLWDLKKKQIKNVFTGHKSKLVTVQFNSNGDFFGADQDGCIKLWSSKTFEAVNITEDNRAIRPTYQLTKLAISSIVPIVAAGYEDGVLRVWDIATGINPILQLPTHVSKISDVSCSTKNPRLLATASSDEHIHLIDTGAPTRFVCSSIHVEQRVSSISFHEDGMHCAVGATDGTIMVYDWRNTSEPISVTSAHEPFPVHALSFQSYRPTASKESNSEYSTTSLRNAAAKVKDMAAIEGNTGGDRDLMKAKETTAQEVTALPAATPERALSNRPTSESPAQTRIESSSKIPYKSPADTYKSNSSQPPKSNLRYPSTTADLETSYEENRNVRISVPEASSEPSLPASVTVGKIIPFEDEYKRRIGAYLEVGQDRIYRKDRDLDEDIRQSMKIASAGESSRPSGTIAPKQNTKSLDDEVEEFSSLREAVRPVSHKELEEALELLKYDIHQELQEVMREQVRQFTISKV